MNRIRSITLLQASRPFAALLTGFGLIAGTAQGATFSYDFEEQTIGNLDTQDNWGPQITGAPFVVSNGVGTNSSQVVGTEGSASSNFFGRENNLDFSFGDLSGQPTLFLGFDLRYVNGGNGGINNQALFNLVHDPGGVNQSQSPAFGLNGNALIVSGAGSASLPSGLDFGEWFSLRLVIDTTAFLGDGSGSLFYKNLSDADAGFTPVIGMQNLGLSLLTNEPGDWDMMLLRTGFYEDSKIDNLFISTDSIPEPTSLFLLSGGWLGLLGYRRR